MEAVIFKWFIIPYLQSFKLKNNTLYLWSNHQGSKTNSSPINRSYKEPTINDQSLDINKWEYGNFLLHLSCKQNIFTVVLNYRFWWNFHQRFKNHKLFKKITSILKFRLDCLIETLIKDFLCLIPFQRILYDFVQIFFILRNIWKVDVHWFLVIMKVRS